MSRTRNKLSVVTALLVIALSLGGIVEESHDHASLSASGGHAQLPVFEPGCDASDHRGHIETAKQLETASCVACLLRQRERGVESQAPRIDLEAPAARTIALASGARPVAASSPLPPARAPPRA